MSLTCICKHDRECCTATLMLVFFLLTTLHAQSDAPSMAGCKVDNYEVLALNAVALHCTKEPTEPLSGTGELFVGAGVTAGAKPITSTVQSKTLPHNRDWILLSWPSDTPGASLAPGKTYTFRLPALTILAAGPSDSGQQTDPHLTKIDTTDTVTVIAKLLPSNSHRFEATSHVAFSADGHTLAYMLRNPNQPGERELKQCQLPIKSISSTPQTLKSTPALQVQCSQLESIQPSKTYDEEVSALSNIDLTLVGRYDIELSAPPGAPAIPESLPALNIFNRHPAFDPKSRLARQTACATKQACNYYINVNYAAGVGAVPGWVLDGKITQPQISWHQFFLAPALSADVGNNSVSGQTYTNTIDLGATAQRTFLPGPKSLLQAMVLNVGPNYETDKQFDRDNLLLTGDLQFFFSHLYKTQEQKALQLYSQQIGKLASLQLSDIPVPKTGYDIDFHAGIETGGSLTNTTVDASKGSATETLPQYSIFRLVPQAHLLLQLQRFSFDELFVGRYLVTTENTVVETASHSLYLKQVQGWKGISTFTTTFAIDPQGHFNISVAFKDGFAAPTYHRVNCVQGGITLKY
jgi:hypothetical protein